MLVNQSKIKREGFSSGLAVFFATLSSAVGLGNIWKFPALTGMNGGGAFLLLYLICTMLVGIPVMISEFYIGRRTKKNSIGAFECLKPGTYWKYTGVMGVLSVYLIIFFYSSVAGWVYSYLFKALKGDFYGITPETAAAQFGSTITAPLPPVIWQLVVIAVISIILISGVKNGIERVSKTLMPILFILIIICDIRAISLPGAYEGIRFLFEVDFSKITAGAVLTALGLSFFKLSLGMGTMITYGSYFTSDSNIMNNSCRVALSDLVISLLAGIAIFPAVFSFGMEPGMGPGLLFITIPLVFSKIQFGNILLIAFFFISSIAATMASISMVEVPVAYFTEEKGFSRTKSVLLNSAIIAVLGVLASLSADQASLLGNIKILGKTFFNLFDFLSSNVLLPFGGLLIALFTGYFISKDEIYKELTNHETLRNKGAIKVYLFIVKYITPILLAIVFLYSLGTALGILKLS